MAECIKCIKCIKCGMRDFEFYPTLPNICKQCHKARMRRTYATDGYRKRNAARQQRLHADPEHHRRHHARVELGNATRQGKITKSGKCSVCGSAEEIQGHHEDYSKPLDVVWLCRDCHAKAHAVHGNELTPGIEGYV